LKQFTPSLLEQIRRERSNCAVLSYGVAFNNFNGFIRNRAHSEVPSEWGWPAAGARDFQKRRSRSRSKETYYWKMSADGSRFFAMQMPNRAAVSGIDDFLKEKLTVASWRDRRENLHAIPWVLRREGQTALGNFNWAYV